MKSIINWFNGKRARKNEQAFNESGLGEIEESLLDTNQIRDSELHSNRPHHRFFVFSLCLSDDLIISDSNKDLNIEPITSLLSALTAAVDLLSPSDFVCFNIANTSVKLFNDN